MYLFSEIPHQAAPLPVAKKKKKEEENAKDRFSAIRTIMDNLADANVRRVNFRKKQNLRLPSALFCLRQKSPF